MHTWDSKPMSNMRSASSKTRKVARSMEQAFSLSRSIMRPGVHTATCAVSQSVSQSKEFGKLAG